MPEEKPRDYRTREDPFADVWPDIARMLENDAGLQSQTLMQHIIDLHGERFHWGQLRTLQRRIQDWRALEGPEKDIIFPQVHYPGKQSQSDWTDCNKLGVTIAKEPFPHCLFHFALSYSCWETAHISQSESFENLTCGYMKAVAELGAVPEEHRTDNLTAAVNNHGNAHVFNERWAAFLKHYDVRPSKNNPGESHENGKVEKSNHLLKNALDQALRLRGSRDFATVAEYEKFIKQVLARRNSRRKKRLDEEKAVMKDLPKRDWNDPSEVHPRVTSFSTISVDRVVYSVPSRLIGQELRALVYPETVRVFLGRQLVQEMPRLAPGSRKINYRHVIPRLVRKPGAFATYQYREELFPSVLFRQAYDALVKGRPERADKDYLGILNLAAMGSEQDVEAALSTLLEVGELPLIARVRDLVKVECPSELPPVYIPAPELISYDLLLTHLARAPKEVSS